MRTHCRHPAAAHHSGGAGPWRVATLLFFAVFFLIVYFRVDPKLIHHGHGEFMFHGVFLPNARDLAGIPSFPGKAAEFLGGVLSRYFHWSLAGALIITALGSLLCATAGRIISLSAGPAWKPLQFVVPGLLLLEYGRYYHFPADTVALLACYLFFIVYVRLPVEGRLARILILTAQAGVLYLFAAQAFFVFILLCIIHEVASAGNRLVGVVAALPAFAVPWLVGRFLFGSSLRASLEFALPVHRNVVHVTADARVAHVLSFALCFSLPLALLACLAVRRLRRGAAADTAAPAQPPAANSIRSVILALAPSVLLLAAFLGTSDRTAFHHLRIDCFSRFGEWDALLAEARKLSMDDYTPYDCHDMNRALFHTGRLAYDMFSYPQHISALLLTRDEKTAESLARGYAKRTRTLYEMGRINQAEHETHEALELTGYNPEALERLATINMIKGNTNAARIFLNALCRDSTCRDWSLARLARIRSDPGLTEDQEVQNMRSLMQTEDVVSMAKTADEYYGALLRRNPRNRMAFEYLMAFCLLTGQPGPVAASLSRLDCFDYPAGTIPTLYEEAILLHTRLTGEVANLRGRRMSPESVRRFGEFTERYRKCGNDSARARRELEQEFGNTYYFFYFLGARSWKQQ